MPSSYTPSLRLTLPVTGELAGSWGATVNTGVTSLAEAAIAGTSAVTMTDADYTLTVSNGATDQARNMFITLTGTLSASRNVICPSVSKLYVVTNNTAGSQNIVFKTLSGSGITLANGQRKMLYCNGTNVLDATTGFTSLIFDAGTVSAPSISFAGNTNTGFWLPVTSTVALSTAGSERLRVDASGNLGLGTSAPTKKMDIAGFTRLTVDVSGATPVINALNSTASAQAFLTLDGSTLVFKTGNTERARFDSSGNLALGGTTASYKLDVTGVIRAQGGSSQNLLMGCVTGVSYVQSFGPSSVATPLAFWTGLTEKMRLDAVGNFCLGTTSIGTNAVYVIGMANATAPTTSPAGMGQLYVEAGALKFRGASGTVTTIAPA